MSSVEGIVMRLGAIMVEVTSRRKLWSGLSILECADVYRRDAGGGGFSS